jgi:two-component system nitrogen regulation response regulator NtrX
VDDAAGGLRLNFHVVNGACVRLPNLLLLPRRDGRPDGIAMHVAKTNAPHLCRDSERDEHYAPYFHPVRSIAAVPIPYQRRAMGVLSVASERVNAFDVSHVERLKEVAAAAAKFLRRAQLYRETAAPGRAILIKGLSPEWLEVERKIEAVSDTLAPVLIRGESGTGKELVAHALHYSSPRRRQPLVVVNIAAVPETLVESVLFGHVRGAFTGATATKRGEFEKADGGTLFLDELGELTPSLQVKLLRAVETGEVSPLGSSASPKRVDVRLIAATNRNLEEMMLRGAFREDLYYRLAVVTVTLPPLRTFKDNLAILVQVFTEQANARYGRAITSIEPAALERLRAHDFPGNLRELRNVVDHAVVMARGGSIALADLPSAVRDAPAAPGPSREHAEMRRRWLEQHEPAYLRGLLHEADGDVRMAAKRAGLHAVTFYRLMRRYGIATPRRRRM